MSELHNTQQPLAEPIASNTIPTTMHSETAMENHTAPVMQSHQVVDGNNLESHATPATHATPANAALTEESKLDTIGASHTATAERVIEPITEGQLGYKGPGLLK